MTAAGPLVAVVGAAGRVGPLVVAELVRRGARARGLVPAPDRTPRARENGCAEVMVADLRDAAAVARAVDGVQAVFHIGPQFAPDEAEMGVALVAAAAASGVERFVFSGVVRPDNGLDNHAAKLPVQAALYTSGMQFTILQPVTLLQNLAAAWPQVVRTGEFAEPFPADVPIARVDYRDVAEVAAEAATTERFAGATLELAAETHDRKEVAALLSMAAGKPVAAVSLELTKWAAEPDTGVDRAALSRVFADYAANGSPGNPLALEAALGRAPRGLAAYLAGLAHTAGGGTVRRPAS